MRKFILVALSTLFFNEIFFSLVSAKTSECNTIEEKSTVMRLKNHLFCNYDSTIRPKLHLNNSTQVELLLVPKSADFDDFTGNLDLQGWLYMSWEDEFLHWNSSEYDDISSLFIPSYHLWLPDIAIHSVGSEDSTPDIPYTTCVLHRSQRRESSTVTCVPLIRYKIRCQTDFTMWPFDRQNCSLVLASWMHTSEEISLHETFFSPAIMDHFRTNGEWDVVASRAVVNYKKNYHRNARTSALTIDFILDRTHNQLSGLFVSPGIIMMIMTLTTLWLDPRSVERLAVACLNPLVHVLCIADLHWTMPHNGTTVPNILLFYTNSFILATLALLLTFMLRKIQSVNTTAPKWASSLTALILRSKAGQILLLSMLDPKAAAGIERDADDTGDLVRSDSKEPTWGYVAILCGWISFISFFFTYVIMYAALMPNSSMRPPVMAIDHF